MAHIDRQFAAYVRDREEHHLRVAVLLTGDWHAAEDLVQASLIKLYRGPLGRTAILLELEDLQKHPSSATRRSLTIFKNGFAKSFNISPMMIQ
jgi:hypothetical protein